MSYDFIFVGAGPAGLTGAIHAARRGRRCLLVDKKQSLGLHPRGETLRHRPILDEILGAGVMDSITIAATTQIDYYAPEPAKADKIVLHTKTPNLTFEWHNFMSAFERQLGSLEVDFILGAEVVELIEDVGRVTGVVFLDAAGNKKTATGGVVFACDGHNSLVGRKLGVDYSTQNYPIVKSLFRNAAFDNPAFKFFFLPTGCLEVASYFPPAIAFLFPRDGANCEVGFMVEAGTAAKLDRRIPDRDDLLRVWGQLIKKHPVFSGMLSEASDVMMETTMLPMGGPQENVIPAKGVVLLGDAAGFVETFGGSGLVSSMESAKFWVNAIINQWPDAGSSDELWSDKTVAKLNDAYHSFGSYKHIKRTAEYTAAAWNHLFVELRSSQRIMENWQVVRSALDIY